MGRSADRILQLKLLTDVGAIQKDVAQVNKQVTGATKVFKGLGAAVVAGFAVDTVVDFAKGAIDAASDLRESMSKVEVVFGDSANEIKRWSQSSATDLGLSQQAALEAAGTFGNLFDAIGLTESASVDMSKGVVQLAADLASFNNASIEDTLAAIQSGLLGEAEPMRKFGSNLSAARVEAYAMAQGWVKNKTELTDAMKTQARYNLILEDTINASGDFARTADNQANKTRTAEAKMADLNARIGEILAPLGTLLVDAALGAMEAIENLGEAIHNIDRFFDPAMAAMEDFDKNLRALAEARGVDADALMDWLDAKRNEHRAYVQGRKDAAALHEQARIIAQGYEMLMGYWEDGALSQTELADSSRYVTEEMRRQGYAVNEAGTEWVPYAESAQGAAEATKEANTAILTFMGEKGLAGLLDIGGKAIDWWGEMNEAAGSVKEGPMKTLPAWAKTKGYNTGDKFGMSLVQGLRDSKDDLRVARNELTYTLEHPYDPEKERANLHGVLVSKETAKGIRKGAKDPYVRDSTQRVIDTVITRLRTMQSLGYDVGADLAVALGMGFENRMSGILAPLRKTQKGKKIPGGASLYDLINTPLGHRASGGPVSPGKPYIVGEEGPEVMVPGRSGTIIPNGGGGTIINIHVTVSPTADKASVGQEIISAIQAAERRTGKGWRN